ncbi:MAG: SRPBCC family protein [Solirubrobacteraceae bacterium]
MRRSGSGGAASHLSGLALCGSVPRLSATYAASRPRRKGSFDSFLHLARKRSLLLGASALLYGALARRRVLTWGASAREAASSLPGDELLGDADGSSTRAINIAAPASYVWPWLAQLGPAPRGGAYTYDWIENLLGLNMHSTDRVLDEFQHPQVGDSIGLGANQMTLQLVEPERVLAWRSQDGNWVWTFVLREQGDSTRLISRNRFRLPTLAARLGMLPMEPASLVMERKMLLGIKQRAERLATLREPAVAA